MLPREGIEDAAIGMLQQPAQSTVYPISKRLLGNLLSWCCRAFLAPCANTWLGLERMDAICWIYNMGSLNHTKLNGSK